MRDEAFSRSGRRGRIRDVIALWYARGRNRRAARAIALHDLLLAYATLGGNAVDVVRRFTRFGFGARPLLVELDTRIRMAICLVRRPLATTSRAHDVAFPVRFRMRV